MLCTGVLFVDPIVPCLATWPRGLKTGRNWENSYTSDLTRVVSRSAGRPLVSSPVCSTMRRFSGITSQSSDDNDFADCPFCLQECMGGPHRFRRESLQPNGWNRFQFPVADQCRDGFKNAALAT